MFFGAKWFSVERYGYLLFEDGFCAGNLYFLWFVVIFIAFCHSIQHDFFLQGNLFNEKNVPAMFFRLKESMAAK